MRRGTPYMAGVHAQYSTARSYLHAMQASRVPLPVKDDGQTFFPYKTWSEPEHLSLPEASTFHIWQVQDVVGILHLVRRPRIERATFIALPTPCIF